MIQPRARAVAGVRSGPLIRNAYKHPSKVSNRGPMCMAAEAAKADVITDELEASAVPDNDVEQKEESSFLNLGVDDRLTVMLPQYGIETPSEIQQQAIPMVLEGKHVAIQSHTGSGKTLAYLLPIMTMAVERLEQRVNQKQKQSEDPGPVAVIICPSRELAMQTVRVAHQLIPKESWPLVQQAIGGANMRRQLENLKANRPLIVIGTPGRLADHSRGGTLRTHSTSTVVLDEADQLLCHQFREDMIRILAHCGRKLPDGPQAVAASATMSPQLVADMSRLIQSTLPVTLVRSDAPPLELQPNGCAPLSVWDSGFSDPAAEGGPTWGWGQNSGFWQGRTGAITARGTAGGAAPPRSAVPSSLAPHVPHCYVTEVRRHHIDAARRVVHALDAKRALVFMNHQDRCQDTMFKLRSKGLLVDVLHGEMHKQRRQAVMERFRLGKFRVLVVSDVVARGLDFPECDAVINLELPSNPGHYAHRAGRTGRFKRPGVVCSILEKQNVFVMERLSRSLKVDIPPAKVMGGQVTVLQNRKVKVLGKDLGLGAEHAQAEEREHATAA